MKSLLYLTQLQTHELVANMVTHTRDGPSSSQLKTPPWIVERIPMLCHELKNYWQLMIAGRGRATLVRSVWMTHAHANAHLGSTK